MKRYQHQHARKKKPTERVSFYIALSVCMMAVGFAAWSAYSTFNGDTQQSDNTYFSSLSTEKAAVAQEMTGVTEAPTQAPTVIPTQAPTASPTQAQRSFTVSETKPVFAQETVTAEDEPDALQAVLRVKESLVYPVKSRRVSKPYSEDGVYNKTLRDYRAHTGCDFAAEKGESVYAMCGGVVKNISVSELYGAIIEVDCGDFSVYYCGMDTSFAVEKGEELEAGDTIGTVGMIPSENEDGSHIHVEVRVGNRTVDPLSVIDSES